eukprot:5166109-Amphidinium_carterae.1
MHNLETEQRKGHEQKSFTSMTLMVSVDGEHVYDIHRRKNDSDRFIVQRSPYQKIPIGTSSQNN